MFRKITSAKVQMASWMEDDCQDLVRSLLRRTVSERLGFKNDVEDIKGHQWFANVDWQKVYDKEVTPPYRPEVDGDKMDVPQNVSRRYLKEAAVDTFADKPEVDVFDGFTFDGARDMQNGQGTRRVLTGGSLYWSEWSQCRIGKEEEL